MNYENYIYQQPIDPTRQAILLAMTQSMEQEKEMIRELQGMGVKCVATMAAGFNFDISPKLINNLVGACLNANIIEKKKAHIHPVVHALHEAMDAARITREISQNCRLKVGVVLDTSDRRSLSASTVILPFMSFPPTKPSASASRFLESKILF